MGRRLLPFARCVVLRAGGSCGLQEFSWRPRLLGRWTLACLDLWAVSAGAAWRPFASCKKFLAVVLEGVSLTGRQLSQRGGRRFPASLPEGEEKKSHSYGGQQRPHTLSMLVRPWKSGREVNMPPGSKKPGGNSFQVILYLETVTVISVAIAPTLLIVMVWVLFPVASPIPLAVTGTLEPSVLLALNLLPKVLVL